MCSYFLKLLFALLVVCFSCVSDILGFNPPSHVKCIDRERQALLNFKHGLRDHSGMLSTWRDDENNRDCCQWEGVECENKTSHVRLLYLRGPDFLHALSGDSIAITSLFELQNMEYLDLSYNNFGSSQIPQNMSSFKSLRYLDLSWSHFAGRIPYDMGNLSNLEHLYLGYNYLDGPIPSQLGKLTSLQYLGLSGNGLYGEIPYQLGNLSQLRYLDLSSNMLTSSTFQLFNHSLNLQELFLSHNNIVLSSSLHFPNFPSLVILDLSYNNLKSLIFQGTFNFNTNLQKLHLENCSLTDESFLVTSASTKNFSSSLVTLDVSRNLLKSSAIFHWISIFTTNLYILNLQNNSLEGPIPYGFGKVMNSLEVLYLGYNQLQGNIPASIGNICTLKVLYLNNNKLQGEIPASLGKICTLQGVYLDHNNLSGDISTIIQNSSWCNKHIFQFLRLSYNQITGRLPNFSIFTSLRELSLAGNQLAGDVIESYFSNLTKLKYLDLTDNSLSLKFGATWVPPFQLAGLGLASCKLGPSFPSWLQTQKSLIFLDISNGGIDDFVPEWFWSKLQYISEMNMSCNNLKGPIPNLPIKLSYLPTVIDLNSNQLEGEIPSFLSQAIMLDLSQNKITNLNTLLCRKDPVTKMSILDLSNNQIMGQLSDCWEHLKISLEFLDLSNNKLSGEIPQSMGTLANLKALVLRNNSLTGELPFTLKNCTRLKILDVNENLLFGAIPSWIGENLHQLKILSLRLNRFHGSVPIHLCYLSQIHLLDLSRNNLSGGIPTCFGNLTAMMETTVISNEIVGGRTMTFPSTEIFIPSNVLLMWKGQDYVFLNPEYHLKSIDLSSNKLSGEIPKQVGNLLGLVSLNLSRNKLDGEIPLEMGNLIWLEFLDLSRNHLHGKIPSTLSKIDRLGVLDLSNNDLTGRIPWGRQLQTFDASSFEGNIGLCGDQLNKSCSGDNTGVPSIHEDDDKSIFYEALYMSLGIGFFAGFWGLLGPLLLWKPWRIVYLKFLNRLSDYILLMIELNATKCHRWLKG